ncbi:MAG: VOC family protein [Gemmatimonadetes bacterium]|nr:VOC family protein [Gemmatimonadota bacterium]
MINQMHSVAVFVNDLDRAIAFYRDTLGLAVNKQGSFGAEFLEAPPHLGVHPAGHPDAKAMVGRHTGITFFVPGLLHLCGELHAKGVTFVSEPTQMAWGVMAMIADPDGNIFALWEDQLPGQEPA